MTKCDLTKLVLIHLGLPINIFKCLSAEGYLNSSGFKYGLLIEDAAAEDDLIVDQGDYRVFVDPFSAQYINGVVIDYTSSMQGSGFTFKNPNATGGCGCGSSFSA